MNEVNILNSLINHTERVGFIDFLNKRNKRKEGSNIELYKAFVNGREDSLKVKWGSNKYNVTKKRLSDRLLDYVAGHTVETDVSKEIQVIRQLVVARKLLAYGEMKFAFKILKQAETAASSIHNHSLLNEIYHTLIEYSYHDLSPNQEDIYGKFEINHTNFLAQERLNMVYAVINKAFIEAEHKREEVDFRLIMHDTLVKFGMTDQQLLNFRSIFQLAQLTDLSGAYSRSYYNVDLYFEEKIKELAGGLLDSEKDLPYHIDVLYLLANIYFRKKDFQKSKEYLVSMKEQMKRYDNRYYISRLPKYVTILSLNLNYTGNHQEAASLIDDLIANKKVVKGDLLNVYLIRAMIYFQQNQLREVSSVLSKFHRSDSWYEQHIGADWVLNKKYIEILLHIELGNNDYVDSRINSFIRTHGEYIKQEQHAHVLPFLKLVKKYYANPEIVTSNNFKQQVEKGITWKSRNEEDIFFMSFYAWLKSKMERSPLYETTLEIVGTIK